MAGCDRGRMWSTVHTAAVLSLLESHEELELSESSLELSELSLSRSLDPFELLHRRNRLPLNRLLSGGRFTFLGTRTRRSSFALLLLLASVPIVSVLLMLFMRL